MSLGHHWAERRTNTIVRCVRESVQDAAVREAVLRSAPPDTLPDAKHIEFTRDAVMTVVLWCANESERDVSDFDSYPMMQ